MNGLSIRIKDSVFVTVANITFYASAISAGGLVSDIHYEVRVRVKGLGFRVRV